MVKSIMKEKLSFEDSKKIALQGLIRFREICEKYGLRYYLGDGTLLGCIRHKGFIPWDDDIDVYMPREDYQRLVSLAGEVEDDDWKLLSHDIDKNFLRSWMKLTNKHTVLYPKRFNSGLTYGIMIDIFPLDYILADNIEEAQEKADAARIEFSRAMKVLQPIAVTRMGFMMYFKRIIKRIYYMLYGKKKVDYTNALAKLKSYAETEKTDYLCCLGFPTVFPTASIINDLDPQTGSFENESFSIPYDSHAILTACYGDYMTPPPKEEQVPLHHGVAFLVKE